MFWAITYLLQFCATCTACVCFAGAERCLEAAWGGLLGGSFAFPGSACLLEPSGFCRSVWEQSVSDLQRLAVPDCTTRTCHCVWISLADGRWTPPPLVKEVLVAAVATLGIMGGAGVWESGSHSWGALHCTYRKSLIVREEKFSFFW